MYKVVLVEDDATMLSLLSTLLEFEGYEPVPIEGDRRLEDLLGVVRQEKPALVLLDVQLGSFNGLDLLRAIRSDPNLKHTRVLMSSGMDMRAECLRAGADGFAMKPYMPEELIEQMQELLEA
jgi:two-component system response regulator MtrA